VPSDSPYGQAWLAAGYATSRPPVHRKVLGHVAARLAWPHPAEVALDIGCGAGASTSALLGSGLGRRIVGIDPSAAMVRQATAHVEGAAFLVGRAEALPVGPGGIGLATAAGSIGCTTVRDSLAEARRVLSADGVLVVYDFAFGHRSARCPDLAIWHTEWLDRWPMPTTGAATIDSSTFDGGPLELTAWEFPAVTTTLTLAAYLDYLMTEGNVAGAVGSGESPGEIRSWCEHRLRPLFGQPLPVEFDAYYACLRVPA
jgi:SAM-dependent methyltransferase